jgi:hypothetical protein
MTVHVLPDIERLVIDWALATDALTDLVDDRIYSTVPNSPVFPLIRVMRWGGVPPQQLHWLDQASMQIDVWGGRKAEASEVARTVAAYIAHELPGAHALGVVTATQVGGPRWEPDASYTPAKPRYVVEASVWFHPNVTSS